MLRTTIFGLNFFILELVAIPFLALAAVHAVGRDPRITLVSLKARKVANSFFMVCLLFLLAILLSSLGALNGANVVKAFLKWCEIFFVAGLVFVYASDVKRFKRAYWLLWLAHVSILIVSVYQFTAMIQSGGLDLEGLRKVSGHASVFAAAMIAPLASRSKRGLLVFLVLAATAFMSFSRGAWLLLAMLIVYLIFRVSTVKTRKMALASVVLPCLILVVSLASSSTIRELVLVRIETATSMKLPSNRERIGMLGAAADAFLSSPVVGIGAENFADFLFKDGIPRYVTTRFKDKITPHNFFFQVAAETGAVGFCTIVLFFVFVTRMLFHRARSDEIGDYTSGLRLYFAVLLFHLLTAFIASEFRFSIGIFCGLALASLRHYGEDKDTTVAYK